MENQTGHAVIKWSQIGYHSGFFLIMAVGFFVIAANSVRLSVDIYQINKYYDRGYFGLSNYLFGAALSFVIGAGLLYLFFV